MGTVTITITITVQASQHKTPARAGLLERVVWVVPSWDREVGKRKSPVSEQRGRVEIGTVSGHPKRACSCQILQDVQPRVKQRAPECEDATGSGIRQERCEIDIVIPYRVISEAAVLGKSHEGLATWEDDHQEGPVILDIDEDYFGCESPARQLHKKGKWSIKHLRKAKELMQPFCVADAAAEAAVNEQLQMAVTEHVLRQPRPQGELPPEWDSSKALCKGTKSGTFKEHVKKFIKHVKHAVKKGASAEYLLRYGFCTHPESFGKAGYHAVKKGKQPRKVEMEVCLGASSATERSGDRVVLHTPSPERVDRMLENFGKIIWKLSNVQMVTICRSSRDGYTARHLFKQTEAGILKHLSEYATGIGMDLGVVYDEDLFMGAAGWSV